MLTRSFECSEFRANEKEDEMLIEGYFSVFDKPYYVAENAIETVARGAFKDTLDGDIKALINHDSRLVLGRTTAGTLSLKEDSNGLWGSIKINPKDSEAVNCYERVKRGDVSQCSFGFEILDETTDVKADGSVHWTINQVRLHEVSVVTFPAYQDTAISARAAEADNIRAMQLWKLEMHNKIGE